MIVEAAPARSTAAWIERPSPHPERLLDKLSLGGTPRLVVYNKTDRLTPPESAALQSDPDAVGVCALDRASMVGLLERIGIELTRLGRRARPYHRETAKSVGCWRGSPTRELAQPQPQEESDSHPGNDAAPV